jgi:hypothetical protein
MSRTVRKHNGSARPIRSKRDFEGASAVAKRLSAQAGRDSAAELRLQALLREMDKFEEDEDDPTADLQDHDYSGPRRRWSDDGSD